MSTFLSLTVDGNSDIEDDGQGNVQCYNEGLATFSGDQRGWSYVNWLFAECYL